MDILVRRVQIDDAEAVVNIINPIIDTGLYTVFDEKFTIESEREYINNIPDRGIFLVADNVTNQSILGFQSIEPFATYTHAFDHVGVIGTYVDLDHRRQGIAKRLFDTMYELACQKGYEKIFTYVRSDNPTAITTYTKQGFRIIGNASRQARINGKYIDEILIERFL